MNSVRNRNQGSVVSISQAHIHSHPGAIKQSQSIYRHFLITQRPERNPCEVWRTGKTLDRNLNAGSNKGSKFNTSSLGQIEIREHPHKLVVYYTFSPPLSPSDIDFWLDRAWAQVSLAPYICIREKVRIKIWVINSACTELRRFQRHAAMIKHDTRQHGALLVIIVVVVMVVMVMVVMDVDTQRWRWRYRWGCEIGFKTN